ncbi:MAG: glycosyltransferase family 9 protein [Gemmatimonadales bacterium]
MAHRVLVVRFGSLGDVVLTAPVVRLIRERYPEAEVTYVTKARWAPIVERMSGVNRTAALMTGESVASLAKRVGGDFDYRVDLHASLRSRLLRWRVPGPWRVVRGQRLQRRWRAWRHRALPAMPHMVECYLRALREAGLDVVADGQPGRIVATGEDRAQAAHVVEGDYTVICPGAAHANKRWPVAHWQALIQELGGTVVATGTGAERGLLPTGALDAFGLPLGPTAALLAGARCVIANDSGLMHLAGAVGTPVVALFGPTSPTLGYAPHGGRHQILERDLPCRPCSTHGGPHCPLRTHACLRGLLPQSVVQAARSLVA